MTFFEDLSPYTYFPGEPPGTLNVGWLDRSQPFPTRETSEEFRTKLRQICSHRVQQTLGFHSCQFCKGQDKPHGSAEIRVPGDGRVYAAPEMLYHYVVAHGYRPPQEFIAAVLAWEEVRPDG